MSAPRAPVGPRQAYGCRHCALQAREISPQSLRARACAALRLLQALRLALRLCGLGEISRTHTHARTQEISRRQQTLLRRLAAAQLR
jgi:hypothetical protein